MHGTFVHATNPVYLDLQCKSRETFIKLWFIVSQVRISTYIETRLSWKQRPHIDKRYFTLHVYYQREIILLLSIVIFIILLWYPVQFIISRFKSGTKKEREIIKMEYIDNAMFITANDA